MAETSNPTMNMLKSGEEETEGSGGVAVETTEEKTDSKVTTKKATAKKATAKSKLKGNDFIEQSAAEIENLTKLKARRRAHDLLEAEGANDFLLGGVFCRIKDEGWYAEWGGETFESFIEKEYGIKGRKARYLMGIYTHILNSGVSWDAVKDVRWTKLKEIAPYLTTDNVGEWVERANGMTTMELSNYIDNMNVANGSKAGAVTKDSPVTMTFKLFPDQKEDVLNGLNKAAKDFGTESNAVALHHLVMSYISGDLGKAKVNPVDFVKAAGEETIAKAMEAAGMEPLGGSFVERATAMGPVDAINAIQEAFPDIELSLDMSPETMEKYNINPAAFSEE